MKSGPSWCKSCSVVHATNNYYNIMWSAVKHVVVWLKNYIPRFSIDRDSSASKVCRLKLSESFSSVFLKCSSYSMSNCEVGEAGSSASLFSFDELGVVAKQCESKISTSSEVGDTTRLL